MKEACPICGPIGDFVSDFWKDSDPKWSGASSSIPPSAAQLVHVAGDAEAMCGRGRALRRCPSCGAWFSWVRSYEFLVGGSEDEESYTRIDDAQAAELLEKFGGS